MRMVPGSRKKSIVSSAPAATVRVRFSSVTSPKSGVNSSVAGSPSRAPGA
jgi:hypothetical protein